MLFLSSVSHPCERALNNNSISNFGSQVLTICNRIMDDVIPAERANRDFRVKFPDDVMQENLAGQLWFGAEVSASFIASSATVSQFYVRWI
jgi:hypothetical protein